MGNVHQFLAKDIGRSGCSASPLFLISNVKNKYMKKPIIIGRIFLVLLLSGVFYLDYLITEEWNERIEHLGETYVLNGDTLKIIDYSSWEGSYTLENGTEIHEDLIVKP